VSSKMSDLSLFVPSGRLSWLHGRAADCVDKSSNVLNKVFIEVGCGASTDLKNMAAKPMT